MKFLPELSVLIILIMHHFHGSSDNILEVRKLAAHLCVSLICWLTNESTSTCGAQYCKSTYESVGIVRYGREPLYKIPTIHRSRNTKGNAMTTSTAKQFTYLQRRSAQPVWWAAVSVAESPVDGRRTAQQRLHILIVTCSQRLQCLQHTTSASSSWVMTTTLRYHSIPVRSRACLAP